MLDHEKCRNYETIFIDYITSNLINIPIFDYKLWHNLMLF